jgi:hypothetical protein
MNSKPSSRKWSRRQLNEPRAARTGILLLLVLMLPAAVQAQFNYTNNGDGTATITGYTGPDTAVTFPDAINGLPVTCIGDYAFYNGGLTQRCFLTSVTIPDSVTSIGFAAFAWCGSLRSATLGSGLRSIGAAAFARCGLTTITIPSGVTSIGDSAFAYCDNPPIGYLTGAYFLGDAPSGGGSSVFAGDLNYVYYLPGTTGWGATFGGRPTAVWNPPVSWFYTINGGTITITGFSSPLRAVTIPDTINGLMVTSIGEWAFENHTNLTGVTIGNSVTNIGNYAFYGCISLTGVTIPDGVIKIGDGAFNGCSSLTNLTIPSSVTNIGIGAFYWCTGLTNISIPDSIASIPDEAFEACISLGNVTIPGSVISIGNWAFAECASLNNVTIPNSVTSIGNWAFADCNSLMGLYFNGNAPSLGGSDVFDHDDNAIVYYLPGTTGWGTRFGGRPTAFWVQAPTIQTPPQTQTAEEGSSVGLGVEASSPLPLFCLWYLNATNLISWSTNRELELTNVSFSQSGAYTVAVSNVLGAVTSAPAMLNVVAAVERRPVPGVKVTGEVGSLLNVDYADSLSPAPSWTTLNSVNLSSKSQYCFDLTLPLPPQRFYRAWQTGTPSVLPSLSLTGMFPAITLTGTMAGSVRLDYINQFGPTDAWVTLATVTLTNTSQLYFDTSAPGQPQRLYRLVQVP